MEPRGSSVSPLRMRRRITTSAPEQDHSRSGASIGRAECREKKIGIEPKGSFFFLTFPLIGHCYTEECFEASTSFLVGTGYGIIAEDRRRDARHTARSCFVWPRHLPRVTYVEARRVDHRRTLGRTFARMCGVAVTRLIVLLV